MTKLAGHRHAVSAIAIIASGALSGWVTPAAAQTAAAQTAATDPANGDIVVTARKTSERLEDVPISVSAVSQEQLRDRGAVDVRDVLRNVPGLSFFGTERGQGNYNIRGISTIASSPTVGIYLDDISLVTIFSGFAGAFDPVFFDMDRLEVLKGPQGTLYGGSSLGGAIKYVSAKPDTKQFSGQVAAGLGTTADGSPSYNGEVILNLPVVKDSLAVRGGFAYRHEGGYVDNGPGNSRNSNLSSTPSPVYTPLVQNALTTRTKDNVNSGDTYVGRFSVLWQPDATWTIQPSAFYQRYKLNDSSTFFTNRPGLTASYRIAAPTTDTGGIYDLLIKKDFGGAEVTSLTAYFDRRVDFFRDYSFLIDQLVPPLLGSLTTNLSASHVKTFSQELRLASTGGPDAKFRWIAGLYYSHQNDNLVQTVVTPGATPILGTEQGYFGDSTTVTKQYAAFADASYEILHNFELTAGIRVFKIKQGFNARYDGPFNGGASAITGRASDEKGVSPKIGASYKVTPDNLLYVSAAKGFRPGGPNRFRIDPNLCAVDLARLGITSAPDSFSSDNLWSYELGSKNKFAHGRGTLNASAFYTDWKKIQQTVSLNNCGFAFTANAGRAKVKGAEVEGQFDVTHGFQVGGNATYTDATISKSIPGTSILGGDEVQAVPKWMVSGFAGFKGAIDDRWKFSLRGEYQYQARARQQFERTIVATFAGGTVGLVPNPAQFRQSYHVVNAFLSLTNGVTSVRVYGNNLLNNHPLIDTDTSLGTDSATTIRPRTIGIEVRQKF